MVVWVLGPYLFFFLSFSRRCAGGGVVLGCGWVRAGSYLFFSAIHAVVCARCVLGGVFSLGGWVLASFRYVYRSLYRSLYGSLYGYVFVRFSSLSYLFRLFPPLSRLSYLLV